MDKVVTAFLNIISPTQVGPYRNSSTAFPKPKGKDHIEVSSHWKKKQNTKKHINEHTPPENHTLERQDREQKGKLQQVKSMGNLWDTVSLSIK